MPNPMFGPFSAGVGASFADADWRDLFSLHLTDGVALGVLSALAVSAGATTTINVASGQAYLRGLHWKVTTTTNLAIAAADPSNPRIDLVVVHANLAGGQTVALQVITGTPAVSPVAPTVTQTEGTAWEIALAQVRVPAGATSSAQYTITDVRSYCQGLILAGGVTSNMLATSSVLTSKIANGAVTDATMANQKVNRAGDTITGNLIINGTISTDNAKISSDGSGDFTAVKLASSQALGGTTKSFLDLTASDVPQVWRLLMDANGYLYFNDQTHTRNPLILIPTLAQALQAWSVFSGTGSGTFSHGLSITPDIVLAIQSTAGSQTMGFDSVTSTQVHITTGGGAAWKAIALVCH